MSPGRLPPDDEEVFTRKALLDAAEEAGPTAVRALAEILRRAREVSAGREPAGPRVPRPSSR